MSLNDLYTKKQIEVLKETQKSDWFMLINHGAKRSGKTILNNDLFLMELMRVRKIADTLGIATPMYILAGVSSKTIQNNILTEIYNKYGITFKFDKHGSFNFKGVKIVQAYTGTIAGLGGIRGMTAFGAYINEASLAKQEVFKEIISRCSGEGARILVDTNPDNPKHWLLNEYINNSDANILSFKYSLDDNTFLGERYIKNIKANTPQGIFYQRDILGNWVAGEGVIYKSFADNVTKFETEKSFNFETINIGVDFGSNKSKHAFCCTGITKGYKELIALASEKHEPDTPEKLNEQFIVFVKKMLYKYGRIDCIYCDSAEQVLIRGMQKALQDNNLNIAIKNAIKNEIINRIRIVNVLMTTSRFFYVKNENTSLVDALQSAVWDSKSLEDKRLDDNTSDIDTLDSFEYSFEKYIKVLSMI
nr:MAG TPA: large terminase [Caudoviricetes sp.]